MIAKTNDYFKCLLEDLTNTQNLNSLEKNNYWQKKYLKLSDEIKQSNVKFLPSIMPLIYPDFLYNDRGVYLGDLINFSKPNFNEGINDSDNCQFSIIQPGGECQFNSFRNIRGKCQADHFWPHSLGGPTLMQNRVLLCKFHNLAKSNSIMQEFWISYPPWLNDYLKRLVNLKN
jgi:5-methylcytosine-specific restriction endonuclease McrA